MVWKIWYGERGKNFKFALAETAPQAERMYSSICRFAESHQLPWTVTLQRRFKNGWIDMKRKSQKGA